MKRPISFLIIVALVLFMDVSFSGNTIIFIKFDTYIKVLYSVSNIFKINWFVFSILYDRTIGNTPVGFRCAKSWRRVRYDHAMRSKERIHGQPKMHMGWILCLTKSVGRQESLALHGQFFLMMTYFLLNCLIERCNIDS